MSVWCVLLCGGSGERMGAAINKTLLPVGGEPGLCRALRALRRHCTGVALVARAQDEAAIRTAMQQSGLAAEYIVPGGADRQQSVANGLAALPGDCDIVLIHDGARPLVDDDTIRRVIDSARAYGSGVAAIPVSDTIKRVNADDFVMETPARDALRAVQTPQGFAYDLLLRAHRESKARCTDDAALVEALGVRVHLVPGDRRNIKLTTREDIALADTFACGLARVGHGYDAHRLVAGRALVLGGVEIAHEKGLLGHSDADVLVHAIIDALLGAAALGDIGRHFPDSDARYKGVSSIFLLEETRKILAKAGFTARNIDATVIAQRPKLAAHIACMRENIARALQMEIQLVSVKATTTEGMGFEGAGEGISAHAVALVAERTL